MHAVYGRQSLPPAPPLMRSRPVEIEAAEQRASRGRARLNTTRGRGGCSLALCFCVRFILIGIYDPFVLIGRLGVGAGPKERHSPSLFRGRSPLSISHAMHAL
ncbi:hypothetical protein NDU88_005067 [Pleurodeles waltl]|uniref:Uncharacterized protein n=1 Tax=Pleurodeles waltl TaxID=8319 RepID=A0AAV7M861_PLEWA|nr:hypothetical protein NDU88_005067 [Pleurodeles waltl]